LISLALSEVVAHARGLYVAAGAELRQWQALAGADAAPLYTPRTAAKAAPCLGADTAEICAGLGLRPPS
jgi:crotonobetainyl-CoA:carnitine CoA-transferase CaiB-like acyl-CoA transferase